MKELMNTRQTAYINEFAKISFDVRDNFDEEVENRMIHRCTVT